MQAMHAARTAEWERRAETICAEAPVLHHDLDEVGAIRKDLNELRREATRLADRVSEDADRLSRLIETTADVRQRALLYAKLDAVLTGAAARRSEDLFEVEFRARKLCLWPAEDRADPDPERVAARKIERAREIRRRQDVVLEKARILIDAP